LTYLDSTRTGEFVVCIVSEDFGQEAVNRISRVTSFGMGEASTRSDP